MKYVLTFASLLVLVGCNYIFSHEQATFHSDSFNRGDRVEIIDCAETAEGHCWQMKNCKKVTYIAGVALDHVNAVWLLVEDCAWYQYPPDRIITVDVITMRLQDIKLKR